MDMSNPLAPIFAASFAVQQILEVLSVLVEKYFGEKRKKMVLGVIGFGFGMILASHFDLYALKYFNVAKSGGFLDTIVTALILSAGTEGTNSIVKFLKYLKEDKKATAADTVERLAARAAGETPSPSVSGGALKTLNKLRAAAGRESPAFTADADPDRVSSLTFISNK